MLGFSGRVAGSNFGVCTVVQKEETVKIIKESIQRQYDTHLSLHQHQFSLIVDSIPLPIEADGVYLPCVRSALGGAVCRCS